MSERLITLSEIADLAGVRPSAVSNWRKRHAEFPSPVEPRSGARELFRFDEVEAWLADRAPTRPGLESESLDALAWSVNDQLRGYMTLGEGAELALAATALISSIERYAPSLLERLCSDHGQELDTAAREAIRALRESSGQLGPTFDPERIFEPLFSQRLPSPVDLSAALWAIARLDRSARASLFEHFLAVRDKRSGRAGNEYRSIDIVAELLGRLVGDADVSVLDPAAGEGGFLYALRDHATHLRGVELSTLAWRTAWQRFLVHDITADLYLRDVFERDEEPADVVVLDPPYNQQASQLQQEYMSRRWPNIPARKVANAAWLYRAYDALAPEGTGYVLLPTATLFRRDESSTRADLVRRGALEAIITLPSGSAAATRIPIALWILSDHRARTAEDTPVLLIEAVGAETQSGGLTRTEVDRIAQTVERFRHSPTEFEPVVGFAVAVSRLDLLAADVNLVPARWISAPESLDPVEAVNDVVARLRALDLTRQLPAGVTADNIRIELTDDPPPRLRIRDLEAQDRLVIIPGVRREPDPDLEKGTRIFGHWDAKSERPRFVEPLDPNSNAVTRPGDIIVTSLVRRIRASVDETGGNTVAAPGLIIRLLEPFIEPDLAVAVLANPESARSAVGVIPRISLRDVELPLLDLESAKTLAEAIRSFDRERAATERLSAEIDAARDSLLSLLSAGPTRLLSTRHEDERPGA